MGEKHPYAFRPFISSGLLQGVLVRRCHRFCKIENTYKEIHIDKWDIITEEHKEGPPPTAI